MLAYAEGCGIPTAFSRADEMKPCPIGESGACCRICSMGPCRLVGKGAEEKTGICGADMPTIAARHFARQVAGGVAAHSDHGRDMAMTLRAVAVGEAAGYKVRDEQKLETVAGHMGIATAGREVNEIALDVADKALEQFGQPHGEIIYTKRATLKRQAKWRELGLTPRAIDREVTEVLRRTARGRGPRRREHPQSALRAPWPTAGAARCRAPTSATSSSARRRRSRRRSTSASSKTTRSTSSCTGTSRHCRRCW